MVSGASSSGLRNGVGGGCRKGRVELGEQGIEFYRKLGRSQSMAKEE